MSMRLPSSATLVTLSGVAFARVAAFASSVAFASASAGIVTLSSWLTSSWPSGENCEAR
jgi:hypothetical protein